MRNTHARNTVRYYIAIAVILLFLFVSNDFGMIDLQKTAIVTAAGVDREGDTFIVTSQIAVPQSSKQGNASKSVQLVSRGKTVAEAFEEINAKTGWYPKLVFCDLIILGEKAVQTNAFDALDFFLRDEYLSDNCLLATCDGKAKDVLNTAALIDPSSSQAIGKILSEHAERVGTVLPSSLREFAIGYFSESGSGFLPILKIEQQQEEIGENSAKDSAQSKENSSSPTQEGAGEGSAGSGSNNQPVFSAKETALFVKGRQVERLSQEETFAVGAVLNKLRLAPYPISNDRESCTLTVKRNEPKTYLKITDTDSSLHIDLTMSAGVLDYSKAQPLQNFTDVGNVSAEFFRLAEQKLANTLYGVYEKCRAVNCDIFGVRERLIKYEKRKFHQKQHTIFQTTNAVISIRFQNVR
jgi:Ger(x)C family germination protein